MIMAKVKTTKKRLQPANGVKFSTDNQPSPIAKSQGWQEWRKERHLTQSIIKAMIGENGAKTETFESYIQSLIMNARLGNQKAIDAVNKCLEDEIIKVAQTDSDGNDAKTELSDSQFNKLLHAITNTG